MNIKNIMEYPTNYSILIYGDTGTGKSTLTGTAPTPILYFDVEGRLAGLPRGKGIDYISINKFDDLRTAYAELLTVKHNYKTFIIDSITEIEKKLIKETLDTPGVKRSTPNLTQGEWGAIFGKMQNLLRSYRDFPRGKGVDLICTATAKDKVDEERVERIVNVSGQSNPYDIMGLFDMLLYTFTVLKEGKTQYKLLTRDTGKVRAKIPARNIESMLDITEGNPDRWDLSKLIQSVTDNMKVKEEVKS